MGLQTSFSLQQLMLVVALTLLALVQLVCFMWTMSELKEIKENVMSVLLERTALERQDGRSSNEFSYTADDG